MNKKLAIIAALAVVGVFAAVVVFSDVEETSLISKVVRYPQRLREQKNFTKLFNQWKAKHNKTYGGVEHDKRFNIFVANYKKYEKINANKKNTFKVGINKFSDLTKAEFSSLYTGLKKKNRTHRAVVDEEVEIENFRVKTNATLDWRQKGAVTPVKNQGQCGSCWAFSTTGSLEGFHFLKAGKLLSFSEQQLVDCSGSYGNDGCDGGLMEYAMDYTAKYGLEQESTYPYTGADGNCNYKQSEATTLNSGYQTANSDSALEKALQLGPVSVSVEADQDVFQGYESGVLNSDECGTNLDHGVLAVGYGTQKGQGYWIVKNSWGADWGQEGYLWIARSSGDGICGINMDNVYPIA